MSFKSLFAKFRWPHIDLDLGVPGQRTKFFSVFAGLVVLGLALAGGGVKAYTFSESAEFCGTLCHSMYPQYERYQFSAHAQVECAECHVGPGAQAFVESKIEGSRQLVLTVLGTYSRPIKSPVHNLRPARETCENCHAPTTFKDNIVKVIRRYDNDAQNTPIVTTLILKMGGVNALTGESKGIHWHVSSEVYYIPLDEQRQVIAWVGVRQADGSLKEYFSRDLAGMGQTAFVEQARQKGLIRRLDCIDCHNRAAHYIPYPEQAVDDAITNGLISTNLPYIRKRAVDLLNATYASKEDAFAAIEKLRREYPAGVALDQAIETIERLYTATNFPDMKLNWKTNPNNERHTPTAGCFRCHDGNHVSVGKSGLEETIRVACNLCHTVPIVGRGDETLVEAPVIVGSAPANHQSFRWTIEHRSITDAEKQECYNCHGQAFCNNGACHNLSHPADMAFTHPQEYQARGGQVCYTCHQNVTCTRCHPAGIFKLP
jgi:nitrate/TMAO reductase-like tetraheme cytochrome c subunit